MDFLQKMFSASGDVSSTRWVYVWSWLVCIVVPIGAWAFKYCQNGTADLPVNLAAFIGTVLLIITGGKGYEKKVEKQDGPKV